MLIRAVRRSRITPAELSTISSVLIEIGGGNKDSVNLSCLYTGKHYNEIVLKNSSTIKKNWAAPRNLLVHWDDKTSQTLDGSSTEKRLSVSVSGKQHKLLGVSSLGVNLKNIYGE